VKSRDKRKAAVWPSGLIESTEQDSPRREKKGNRPVKKRVEGVKPARTLLRGGRRPSAKGGKGWFLGGGEGVVTQGH